MNPADGYIGQVTGGGHGGLFGELGNGGVVRDLGIIAPNVRGSLNVGGLSGRINTGAQVTAHQVQGGASATNGTAFYVGGVAVWNQGTIRSSTANNQQLPRHYNCWRIRPIPYAHQPGSANPPAPAQTRFRLDGLRANLMLGYADCHTP